MKTLANPLWLRLTHQPPRPLTPGHALERSWPTIFDCTDPTISQTCGEGSGPTCQCRDV